MEVTNIEVQKLRRRIRQLERALRNSQAQTALLKIELTDYKNMLSVQSSILKDAQTELSMFQEQAS